MSEIEKLLKEAESSVHRGGHKHSGHETMMSGGANACPICQALEIQSLRTKLAAAEAELEKWRQLLSDVKKDRDLAEVEDIKARTELSALREDKARLDWLQEIYAETLKRNPEAPFGLLTVPLDLNYEGLRQAIDAARKQP